MTAPKRLPPGIDRPKPGTVRARYRDADGHQHSKTFPERGGVRAAQAWLRTQRSAVDEGRHVAPSTRVTVAEYAAQWCDSKPHRPSTARRYASMRAAHIDGTPLGSMKITDVRPTHVQQWVTSRTLLAPSTLGRTYTLCSRCSRPPPPTG